MPTPGSIKQIPPSRIARPAEEQSQCPAMVEHPAVTPSPVDMATTIKDVQELPTGCRTSPRSPISTPSTLSLSLCTEPKLKTDQCQARDRKSAWDKM